MAYRYIYLHLPIKFSQAWLVLSYIYFYDAVNKIHSFQEDVLLKLSHALLKLSSSTMVDAGPGAGRVRQKSWKPWTDQLSCAADKDTSYKEATFKAATLQSSITMLGCSKPVSLKTGWTALALTCPCSGRKRNLSVLMSPSR